MPNTAKLKNLLKFANSKLARRFNGSISFATKNKQISDAKFLYSDFIWRVEGHSEQSE